MLSCVPELKKKCINYIPTIRIYKKNLCVSVYVSCHLKSERSPYIALRSWTIVLAQQNFSHNLVSSLTLPVLIARDPMMTRYNSFERVSTCSMLKRLMCRNCLRVYCEPYHVGHQPRTRSILKKSSEGQERGLGQQLLIQNNDIFALRALCKTRMQDIP